MSAVLHSRGARRRGARGFTLIEALVAMVVLSIGMLGIAGLYLESLRSGRVTILRSQAVTAASDLADRIRANREGAPAYADDVSGAGTFSADCEDGGAGCTPDDMAAHDKFEWLQDIEAALPSGAATVVVDDTTAPDTYTITVTWVEPGIGEQSYVLSFQS